MVSTTAWLAVAGAFVVVLGGEALHARRLRRVARLAFGPSCRPAMWVRTLPLVRSLAAALLTFGLAALLEVPPKAHVADASKLGDPRHLVIVLDVSPSMQLADAGPTRVQQRNQRAMDLLKSLFQRVAIDNYAISVVATYNGAKPVVIDTRDSAVIDNILADLPLRFAFKPGKTRLFDGIEEAARIAKPWEPKSTILAIVSDGDTVPATGMPKLPASVSSVIVVGVGDPAAGQFIDGRQSRQDVSTLRQIATRLGGVYHNGNERHIPTDTVREITQGGEESPLEKLTLREYALLAASLGAAILAVVALLLHLFGTRWRPGVRVTPRVGPGQHSGVERNPLLPEAAPIR